MMMKLTTLLLLLQLVICLYIFEYITLISGHGARLAVEATTTTTGGEGALGEVKVSVGDFNNNSNACSSDATIDEIERERRNMIMKKEISNMETSLGIKLDDIIIIDALNKKSNATFRSYDKEDGDQLSKSRNSLVRLHYTLMRSKQTMEYVTRMERIWTPLNKAELDFNEIFEILKDYVDSSDPDFGLPNTLHNFQTAEAIRAKGLPDWMQLVGVLHDVGKLQFAWGNDVDGQSGKGDGQQYALGGDTWIVGARIPDSVILPELNSLSPDMYDARYNSTLGVYKKGVGLSNVKWCWGHDEYMFRVLENQSIIPKEGLAMIRFHSAYPWHQNREYTYFETDEDIRLIPWVKLFNRFDLYEKKSDIPDMKSLMPYYTSLFKKYIPKGKLQF